MVNKRRREENKAHRVIANALVVKYLGELEDDDLVIFVLEHIKDRKGAAKLVEGLEPVSTSISRQIPGLLIVVISLFHR